MKNKKLLCIIAILLIVSCALSIVLTACGETKNNGNSNGNTGNNNDNNSGTVDQKPFDFDSMTEEYWKSDKVSEKEWKKAFDASNVENYTINYIGNLSIENGTPKYSVEQKVDFFKDNQLRYYYYGEGVEMFGTLFILVENNKYYYYSERIDEDNTTDRDHIANCFYRIEMVESGDVDIDALKDLRKTFGGNIESSFIFLKDYYNDFEYKNNAYYAEKLTYDNKNSYNIKVTFINGKVHLLTYTDEYARFVLRDVGKTSISFPKNFVDMNAKASINCTNHVDNNETNFCDICWQRMPCPPHIDNDDDGWCDKCYERMH